MSLDSLDQFLAKIQRWILVLAAFIVPLIVLPESNFVDITSVPKTSMLRIFGSLQAGILLSRLVLRFSGDPKLGAQSLLDPIRASKSAILILGSIAAVVGVSIISTLFSILPHQSWWGRNPSGFEAGEFTALMYVVLAISALVTVRETKHTNLLWITLAVTGVGASLVGFFQYLGLSPLDISATQGEQITGTNGNPIFFGAMILMLSAITIGVLIEKYQTSDAQAQKFWLGALAVFSFLASVSQISAFSRGPWVGVFIGGTAAAILIAVYARSKTTYIPAVVIILFLAIGTLSALFISPISPVPESSSTETATKTTTSARSVGHITGTSSVNIRIRFWKLSAKMAVEREPVPFTNDAPKVVRWLFGYGPDTWRYIGTHFSNDVSFTRRSTAAHNDPLNRLAEQGFLGLLAWIALWVSLLYGVITLIRKSTAKFGDPSLWLAVAITAALGGRFTEQMFGSPTPGGTLVFWLIVGGLAGLLMNQIATPKPRLLATQSTPPSPLVKYASYSGVALIAVVSIIFAYDKGASYLIATQSASFLNRPHIIPAADAESRLEKSIRLAPDVADYWHGLADIEFGRAESTDDPAAKMATLTQAYEYELRAYEINPIEIAEIYELAFATWELGNAGRTELLQETVDLYERLTIVAPSDQLARERLKTLSDFLAK